MDPVTILNNYRLAIAGDRETLRILAFLYRSGPRSEIQLKEDLGSELRELRAKLNDLYRAHLICFVAESRWATTDLADQVLSRLGIAEVAARSLLDEQDIKDPDKSFLEACINLRASHDEAWPKYQTSLLRALTNLEKISHGNITHSRNELRHLLYGAIVGLDSDAQQLGGANYCKLVIDWHSDRDSELWNQWGGHWTEERATYERLCNDAVQLAVDSNLILTLTQVRHTRKRPSRLTLLRVLGTMTSEIADPAMGAAFRFNRDLSSNVWETLARSFPDIEKQAWGVLLDWGKAEPKRPANWAQKLRSVLSNVLWRDAGTRISLMPLPESNEGTREALTPMRGAWLEGLLLRLRAQIDAGDYDHLTSTDRANILRLLGETKIALDNRLIRKEKSAPNEATGKAGKPGTTTPRSRAPHDRRR